MWCHHLWLRWSVSSYPIIHSTDLCALLDTDNIINKNNGGYEHVTEYIPIAQPNYGTLAQLDELEPSDIIGDRAHPSLTSKCHLLN
jgi:hypothetical protein